MANTTIYCVRHGDVDNPHKIVYGKGFYDLPLSITGRQQINQLGDQFLRCGIVPYAIAFSPQLRAFQSALILSEKLRKADPLFYRMPDFQDVSAPFLEGQSLEAAEQLGDYYHHKSQKNEIEHPESIALRGTMSLTYIRRKFGFQEKPIVTVSHGDIWAFTLFRLDNPDSPLPPITELEQSPYFLPKASAQKLVLDVQGKVLETELIRHDEGRFIQGERGI